jgi:hypothetical protein
VVAEPLIDYRIHAGQQLGVNCQVPPQGTHVNAETRRQFYKRVARQFEDLLQRLLAEGWSKNDALTGKIGEKIAFLKRQSTLSPSLGVRTLQMMGQLPRYMHYARGLGSLRSDLMLGREAP